MTLVEYGSYACQHCHAVHEAVEGSGSRDPAEYAAKIAIFIASLVAAASGMFILLPRRHEESGLDAGSAT